MPANVNREGTERVQRPAPRPHSSAPAHGRLGGSMRALIRTLLVCLLAPAAVAVAQDKPAPPAAAKDKPAASAAAQDKPAPAAAAQGNPLSAFNRRAFGQVRLWLVASAEKMPEESYGFKPVETVRSYGQLIAHVADAQYLFCSAALGEKNPAPGIEKSKTAKADLVAALKDAFAYCDRAYDGMTDASAAQTVKLFGGDVPKLSVLSVNIAHNAEHYGNLVTYMRMKNVVPPSSEAAGAPQPRR